MRLLPVLALLIAGSVHAQVGFELTDPLLLIDGQRTRAEGAPLTTSSFDTLELEIPGWGLLWVSNTPFEGARRAGDFDRTRLVLVVDGRSVRLRSETPLLNADGPVPAFARLDENPLTPTEGPAHLRLLPATPGPERLPPVVEPPRVNPQRAPVARQYDELARQLEALRGERDDLRRALALTEHERDDARLRLAVLREEVDRLRLEVTGSRQPVDQLRTERDALRDEVLRLRASLEAVGTPPALPVPEDVPIAESPARFSLLGFDLTRLRNRDQIEARLRTTPYPEWAEYNGIGGEVLVLFQTDTNGAVVRTAVPRPIGAGLDALAEEFVRAMRFVPVRADGQLTRLRSQVVVRFTP